MSYFASSASTDVVVWHDEQPTHLFEQARHQIYEATQEALHELRTLVVSTEHTMESICDELGIHPFHHNFFGSLAGTTLTLYSNGHLEIRREWQKHATTFPVQLVTA